MSQGFRGEREAADEGRDLFGVCADAFTEFMVITPNPKNRINTEDEIFN